MIKNIDEKTKKCINLKSKIEKDRSLLFVYRCIRINESFATILSRG